MPIILSAEAAGRSVMVSVADRGPGIDDLERMMIFDKIYRGESQHFRVQGTGMAGHREGHSRGASRYHLCDEPTRAGLRLFFTLALNAAQ